MLQLVAERAPVAPASGQFAELQIAGFVEGSAVN
jgi:hypothetical protein